MHRRTLLLVCLLAGALLAQAPPPAKPKLVLAIMVDQFRADYLYRFRADYNAGLDRLLKQGAFFTNAYYQHAPTVTAIGHSTFMSGATPSISGIIGNDWHDRASGKSVTSVSDPKTKLLGAEGEGSSPHRMLVSTIGDEIKMSGRGASKVIGISIKDRSAILPAGRMADGAYWFDNKTGNFVSSTYYFPQLPAWVSQFNSSRAADKFLGVSWTPLDKPKGEAFLTMAAAAGENYWKEMQRTPFGNELIEALAERAIIDEKLGQSPMPDVLAVSFSSNDYIGHDHGPDSPQVRDISIRTDRLLGKLLQFVDARIGLRNVVVVLSADHGVAPVPEVNSKRKMPGGRLEGSAIMKSIEDRLVARHGAGKWFASTAIAAPYLNHGLIRSKRLSVAQVRREVAQMMSEQPGLLRVYTADQVASGQMRGDAIDVRLRNGFHAGRGADIYAVVNPYWLNEGKTGTSHGTPFNYDTHVPVLFMGPWFKAGRFHKQAAPNDIAPTLAAVLEIETPSGSVGRVLDEALR